MNTTLDSFSTLTGPYYFSFFSKNNTHSMDWISETTFDYSFSVNGTPSAASATSASTVSCAAYELAVSVTLMTVTGILGVAGNILTLTVLHYSNNHTVTVFLLNALAISDIILILFCMVLVAVPAVCSATTNCPLMIDNLIVQVELYGWALASMAHTINIYITVLVTIHRFIIVCCSPHIAARISTRKQVGRQLAIIIICSIIYNIPRLFEYEYIHTTSDIVRPMNMHNIDPTTSVMDIPSSSKSQNHLEVEETYMIHRQLNDFGQNFWYQVIYRNVCFCLFIFILPFIVLITLSYKLAQVVKTRLAFRKNLIMLRRKGKEDITTIVLIVIVIIFLVCQMPTLIQRILYLILVDEHVECGSFFFYFSRFTDYLVVVNCSVNFIVYILFARQFRETLFTIVCIKTKRNSIVDRSVPLT